jgi:hypothetical protein
MVSEQNNDGQAEDKKTTNIIIPNLLF